MEPLIKQFKDRYEALNGIVHLVAGSDEAVMVVASVLKEATAERIALAGLPPDLSDAIIEQCEVDGIEVLRPPFNNSGLPHSIDGAKAGISRAAFAIAETGTLVELTRDDSLRLVSSLPEIHIGIIKAEDIIERLFEAAAPIRDFYGQNPDNGVVTFISGPSRSADIEMRLTLGVHGPKASHAIVIKGFHG